MSVATAPLSKCNSRSRYRQRGFSSALATAISPLGRSLRYGRVAGAVSLLVRHEHMAEATALEWLDRLEPDPQINLAVWQRLSAANRG